LGGLAIFFNNVFNCVDFESVDYGTKRMFALYGVIRIAVYNIDFGGRVSLYIECVSVVCFYFIYSFVNFSL
jgi:hypothetical protein